MFFELLLLVLLLLFLFYRWTVANNDFFEKKGIPFDPPFFFFGCMKDVIFRKKSFFDTQKELYEKAQQNKVFGVFEQRNPIYLIRDPELIKCVVVKNFDHFVNHRSILGDIDEENHDLFGNSLFFMKDNKWKDMRSTLSPVFTGSKMRHMFELLNQVAENTISHLNTLKCEGASGIELEMKDFCTRFTNDIIASAAFGLQVNSFQDIDNEFYKMGKKVTTIKGLQAIRFLLYGNFKTLVKMLKIPLFGKKTTEYFMRLVLDGMQYRKKHNIVRPDMINMLMEARGMTQSEHPKHHNREWTDIEIVAQCFLFFFAGFETSSVLMCFTAHELMENPNVQKRLYEEIKEVDNQLNGEPVTYDALQNMKYMDMVISEVLRKWPPAVATDRACNKDFDYTFDDGHHFSIKKGDGLWIPIVGLHYDQKYFSNPDKFEPERFSEENKDKIQPFTYMPFGLGPRNCIGSRFALLEAKALIYYMVREYKIEAAAKTSIPLEIATNSFQVTAKNGFWLKFISRTDV